MLVGAKNSLATFDNSDQNRHGKKNLGRVPILYLKGKGRWLIVSVSVMQRFSVTTVWDPWRLLNHNKSTILASNVSPLSV